MTHILLAIMCATMIACLAAWATRESGKGWPASFLAGIFLFVGALAGVGTLTGPLLD